MGLRVYDRRELGGRVSYRSKALAAVGEWSAILGDEAPLRADAIEDYVGGVFRDADEEI